ncbi:hypothetical protein [Pectobacterium aroidearum]|uniref:hypothetical protein n=1 Tax=Pectobacterium aroidearum TaxID=1201031 RepID=UPI003019E4F1
MRQQKLHVRVTHLTSVADPALPPDNLPASGDEVVLDIVLGPRTDWFTTEAPHLLQNKNWKVSPKPNCAGMRLILIYVSYERRINENIYLRIITF